MLTLAQVLKRAKISLTPYRSWVLALSGEIPQTGHASGVGEREAGFFGLLALLEAAPFIETRSVSEEKPG